MSGDRGRGNSVGAHALLGVVCVVDVVDVEKNIVTSAVYNDTIAIQYR